MIDEKHTIEDRLSVQTVGEVVEVLVLRFVAAPMCCAYTEDLRCRDSAPTIEEPPPVAVHVLCGSSVSARHCSPRRYNAARIEAWPERTAVFRISSSSRETFTATISSDRRARS